MSLNKDGKRCKRQPATRRSNGDELRRALGWILNKGIFADLRLHGNVSWTPMALVQLAIFWVWNNETSLVAAANEAIASVTVVFGSAAVTSYQALTGALKRYGHVLLPPLWRRMQG